MDPRKTQIDPECPLSILRCCCKAWKIFNGFLLDQKNCGFLGRLGGLPHFSSFVIQLISWQPCCCDILLYINLQCCLHKYTFVYWRLSCLGLLTQRKLTLILAPRKEWSTEWVQQRGADKLLFLLNPPALFLRSQTYLWIVSLVL